MSFWKKVDEELIYLGKTRKELSIQANFDPSYIPKGILRGSVPSADLAVRIANALDVSVEYLLEMNNSSKVNSEDSRKNKINDKRLFSKYKIVISQLESLPENERNAALLIIKRLSECGRLSQTEI